MQECRRIVDSAARRQSVLSNPQSLTLVYCSWVSSQCITMISTSARTWLSDVSTHDVHAMEHANITTCTCVWEAPRVMVMCSRLQKWYIACTKWSLARKLKSNHNTVGCWLLQVITPNKQLDCKCSTQLHSSRMPAALIIHCIHLLPEHELQCSPDVQIRLRTTTCTYYLQNLRTPAARVHTLTVYIQCNIIMSRYGTRRCEWAKRAR